MAYFANDGSRDIGLSMPLFLNNRRLDLHEKMDDPLCDQEALFRTYDAFERVNRDLSGWRGLYVRFLRPMAQELDEAFTLLDIGSGGGDITRAICRWAAQDGLVVKATALDIDGRALDYISQRGWANHERTQPHSLDAHISYRQGHTQELIGEGLTFDLIITNHVLHHMSDEECLELCKHAELLLNDRGLVLFNDIHRSDLAYGLFSLATLGRFSGTFIREDGLRSIRRSYTVQELRDVLPTSWSVNKMWPFRVVVMYQAIEHEKQ